MFRVLGSRNATAYKYLHWVTVTTDVAGRARAQAPLPGGAGDHQPRQGGHSAPAAGAGAGAGAGGAARHAPRRQPPRVRDCGGRGLWLGLADLPDTVEDAAAPGPRPGIVLNSYSEKVSLANDQKTTAFNFFKKRLLVRRL